LSAQEIAANQLSVKTLELELAAHVELASNQYQEIKEQVLISDFSFNDYPIWQN
jgi:hypothetical protein